MKRLLLILVLFFPWVATAKENPSNRTCRILFLNPPEDAPKKLFLFDGVASREVELPEMNLSDVHKTPAGDLTLYLTPQPVKKSAQLPPGAPSAKLPASFGDIYLLITPDPENTVAPVRMQVMDAGPQKFRKGQMMWFNLTTTAINGQLGDQKLELAGESRATVDGVAKPNEPFEVNLNYLLPDDPVSRPLTQTKWVQDPRARMVMFVYADADGKIPQITGFKDFRISLEKAK